MNENGRMIGVKNFVFDLMCLDHVALLKQCDNTNSKAT